MENIVVKANKSLGFVRRNLYPYSESTKRLAYVTIIRPKLEYATAVWDPYRQEQIASIEAVQRRAARFIKRDYNRTSSVTEMVQSLDLDLLEDRRKAHRLNILYLAVNIRLHCLYLIIFYLNSTSIIIFIIFIQGQ